MTEKDLSSEKASLPLEEEQIQKRLIELETKMSFQDDLIDSLNDVVVEQSNTIAALSLKVQKLSEQILKQNDDGEFGDSQDEVPPHY